ncbi:hypothetical protein AGLY_002995 [Aphis glycines]|uniref:Uncharacterized protein n=1 Tax=Aphis glycines TaxID=307491 RepID=A0A6G0U1Y4_APHGL|nr:hypothetical protein AGLY_002995 [Aphis glycines]
MHLFEEIDAIQYCQSTNTELSVNFLQVCSASSSTEFRAFLCYKHTAMYLFFLKLLKLRSNLHCVLNITNKYSYSPLPKPSFRSTPADKISFTHKLYPNLNIKKYYFKNPTLKNLPIINCKNEIIILNHPMKNPFLILLAMHTIKCKKYNYTFTQTSVSGILCHLDDKFMKTSPGDVRADNNIESLDK